MEACLQSVACPSANFGISDVMQAYIPDTLVFICPQFAEGIPFCMC